VIGVFGRLREVRNRYRISFRNDEGKIHFDKPKRRRVNSIKTDGKKVVGIL